MGIMVAWFAPNQTRGIDPFAIKPANMQVRYTHGHLQENNNHGGQADATLADPSTLPDGPMTSNITINYYQYSAGDLAHATSIPTVHQGQSIRFRNTDAPAVGLRDLAHHHRLRVAVQPQHGIAYPARRRARSSSIRDSSATAVRRPRAPDLGHTHRPSAGHLRVLVSRPPVHARRIPSRSVACVVCVAGAALRSGRACERRSA